MRFTKEEEAVSPVIGVILMVAITVILAAVIAVFVFGLAGDLESGAQKDVRVQVSSDSAGNVVFVIFSGSDLGSISSLTASNGTATSDIVFTGAENTTVGAQLPTPFAKGDSSVVLTATFNDGTSQVLAKT
ncbi:type IV pilin [Methanoplanus sp. FWC-SCC4]|uniref:Type IV pilin n=1 Tax=Methanochimaera problematica TaxID=2609417 RepID=A0AA97FE14_9EURY|nr:type IV pilin N-terminal domain-containing protein [Methanoplanus sp. FWC-SCC4]WOF16313.1 type IV pilin [Methanoplanus sp. FWC-SCC4]